jgi:sterol 24-C-methyltransferase
LHRMAEEGKWARLKKVASSVKALYSLPKEKVDAFLASYEVYNHDWADEKELVAKMGPNYYAKMKQRIVDWYSVLNHLCAIGKIEKMYIPPAMDLSKGITENQILFEQRMAKDLHLPKRGGKVLDIGCGRGRIANHIASITGAHVTGINIEPGQLENARKFASARHMSRQCEFKLADLNDLPLPFADESLDAVYHVQVFSLAKDLGKLMADIHRVLKPGGRFACLDWVQLDAYDPKNPKHADLMRRIKPLIGAIGTPTIPQYTKAIEDAGFEVIVNENASIDGLQAPMIENADKYFNGVRKWVRTGVQMKLFPKHFKDLLDRFTQDGQAFVKADRMRLVTTSHYFVARKTSQPPQPLNPYPVDVAVSKLPTAIDAKEHHQNPSKPATTGKEHHHPSAFVPLPNAAAETNPSTKPKRRSTPPPARTSNKDRNSNDARKPKHKKRPIDR